MVFVPWEALNIRHPYTSKCTKGAEQKLWQLVEEEAHTSVAEAYQAYGRTLVVVSSFKCLGRVFTTSDDDCPAVVSSLREAR